uniref:Uncharacterized protein n=1 Tax=Hyaloperonospora arabidopsidis (strain Emoy2) TaxID=559515 RepID=M4C0B1_HYAAE
MTADDRNESDELLARAMHRSAASFTLHKDDNWMAWLAKILPSYRPPDLTPSAGGFSTTNTWCSKGVDTSDRHIQKHLHDARWRDEQGGEAGPKHDGVRAACFFLMHFSMNLNCEMATNMIERLKDVGHRLRVSVGMDVEDDVDVLEEVAMDADAARKEEPM